MNRPRPRAPLSTRARMFIASAALLGLFFGAMALIIIPPFLSQTIHTTIKQGEAIDDLDMDIIDLTALLAALANRSFTTVDPELGLPCSRRLVFDSADFDVTDNGCGTNLTVSLNIDSAPPNATYLVLSPDPGLPCARTLVFDFDTFNVTDEGCGGNFTVDLTKTGVTPGFYARASIVVDDEGRLSFASPNGPGDGAPPNSTYFVLTPDPMLPCARTLVFDFDTFNLTDAGCGGNFTVDLTKTGVVAGAYDRASIVVDDEGRLSFAASNTAGSGAPANSTYLLLEPDPSLPCSRVLEFDPFFFNVTDDGCADNYTVSLITKALGIGDGITFGFISGTNSSGYTDVVAKSSESFEPEASWRSTMEDLAVFGSPAVGFVFNTTNSTDPFVTVSTNDRYLVTVQMLFRRAQGGSQRLLFAGLGIDDADPTVFLASAETDDTDFVTGGGTYLIDLVAGTELRLELMQINEDGPTTVLDMTFASLVCTIVTV